LGKTNTKKKTIPFEILKLGSPQDQPNFQLSRLFFFSQKIRNKKPMAGEPYTATAGGYGPANIGLSPDRVQKFNQLARERIAAAGGTGGDNCE
jgi:hypothetical protein